MKKTLAVAAVLAAFAGSAAADVTVYGKIDLGLAYTHLDKAGVTTSTTEMGSGLSSGSRLGFKGSEKIGDLTVGFNYEASIKADQNAEAKTAETTSRVSQVYVKGAYGEVGAGFYGALDGATGPYDFVSGLTANGTGWNDITDMSYVMYTQTTSRLSNAVTYKAPTFAGVTAVAQVGTLGEGAYSHNTARYYGIGAKYQAGAFGAGAVVSMVEAARGAAAAEDDAMNYTAGVNYDFGVAKVFLAANYYEDGVKDHDQYGVHLSAAAPVAGGKLVAAVGYGEVSTAKDDTTKKWTVGAAYQYPLSKQTYLYTAAGYDQEKTEAGAKTKATRVIGGICHNF